MKERTVHFKHSQFVIKLAFMLNKKVLKLVKNCSEVNKKCNVQTNYIVESLNNIFLIPLSLKACINNTKLLLRVLLKASKTNFPRKDLFLTVDTHTLMCLEQLKFVSLLTRNAQSLQYFSCYKLHLPWYYVKVYCWFYASNKHTMSFCTHNFSFGKITFWLLFRNLWSRGFLRLRAFWNSLKVKIKYCE